MSRRPSSRRRASKSDNVPWIWVVLGVFIIGAVAGGFSWLAITASARNQQLAENQCPLTGPVQQTIVLLDVTDTIAPITQTELTIKLNDIALTTQKGGLFELRVLEPGEQRSRILFSSCNPGDGSDLDYWTGNPERAKKRWEDNFSIPLAEALEASLSASEAETSPIMAGIQQIAVERLGSFASRSIPSILIVASDLLENTEYFSMYASGPDMEAFKASEANRRFASDLANAEVTLWMISRASPISSAQVGNFWANWIVTSRGQLKSVIALQGLE